jgi:hypothetical protein
MMDAHKDSQTSLLEFAEAHKHHDGVALTQDEGCDVQFERGLSGNRATTSQNMPTLTPEMLAIALAEGRFKVGAEAILQRAIELVGALCDECFEVLDQFDDCDFEGCVPISLKDVKATTRLFELSNVASSYLLTKR